MPGHLLGSASIEIEFDGDGPGGHRCACWPPAMSDPMPNCCSPIPTAPADFDYVISESTYGDRDCADDDAGSAPPAAGRRGVATPQRRSGALLIPAFAVERTQELLVDLVDLMERGEMPAAPVFLDSPLAIRATEVFRGHARKPRSRRSTSIGCSNSPHLRFTETVDESKAIAKLTGFHIIIAASGMCDAGRIRHHLKRWLWNTRATVLLVGYQAQGTLGRFLAGWRQGRPHPGRGDQGGGRRSA